MNGWELTKEENEWDEVSTNLVHFLISAIVVLQIKHVEECTIVLGVLCWHIDLRNNPVWNIRERRSSQQLKNIIKPSMDLNKNGRVMPVLVILFSQFWGPKISICLWTLFIQYTIQYALLNTSMNICWKMAYKWIANNALEYNSGIKITYKRSAIKIFSFASYVWTWLNAYHLHLAKEMSVKQKK
jgi:hypothetical protein